MSDLATLAAAAVLVLAAAATAPAADVTLTVADGAVLKASYSSPGVPGPALLLIHQCNLDRTSWDGLTLKLVAAGFHVLAPDLRGFGANRVAGRVPAEKWGTDLDAWWSYLLAQPGVDRARAAAGGASCGTVESTLLAIRHREMHALLLLSGTVNLDGKDHIAATPQLAVFGAAAENDGPEPIKEAVGGSKNSASIVRLYPGADHGVDLFRAHRDLEPAVVQWLSAQLAGTAAGR